MSEWENKRAAVISPHQDDVALSLGMHLHLNYDVVDVLNIFTQSASHILDGIPNDPVRVSKIRHDEDVAFAQQYGFHFEDAGFQDAELRGVAWNNKTAPIDADQVEVVAERVSEFAPGGDSGSDLYLPAAFGLHPDHYATLLASIQARGDRDLYLYADQPYYLEPQDVRHGALDKLHEGNGIIIPFDSEEKEKMLAIYPSQLSPARIRRVSAVACEFVWKLDKHTVQDLAATALERTPLFTVPFGNSNWINSVESAFVSKDRLPLSVGVENSDGSIINTPIMVEDQNVEGVGLVKFARHAGVYGSDYLDFVGMRNYDEFALSQLKEELAKAGVRYVWMSNMRDVDGYINLLRFSQAKKSMTFEGIPSFLTTCHDDGFDSWKSSRTTVQKKKMRQIERKIVALNEDHGYVETKIESGQPDHLEDFLNLQQQRAAVVDLDIFSQDDEYSTFLTSAVEAGLIIFANTYAGGNKISTLALLRDEANKSLLILGQGFDAEYSYYSPSYINMHKMIEYAHTIGFKSVDFLRGDERYKRYFTDKKQRLYKHLEALVDVSESEWEAVVDYVKEYEE